MTETAMDRVLALEGVHNFRDFGGYPVAGGGRVRRGLLWRSGQHCDATDADLARIAALRLAVVADLRQAEERERAPCRRPAGFAAEVLTIEQRDHALAPHVAAGSGPKRDWQSTRERLRHSYLSIPFRPELNALLRRWFAALAQIDGPTLINCMAGKDRTGFAVAMLHTALGVHPDDVMADYLMTNTAGDPEARIRAATPALLALVPDLDEAALRTMLGVEPEYLETAFAAIRERHGSDEAYLEAELGLDAPLRERLRERLVES